jgi:hypothetical protein
MKIAGAIKNEQIEFRAEFAIKLLDNSRRRAEAKLRPPFARIDGGQMQRLVSPGVVEIKMYSLTQRVYFCGRD